MGNTLLSITTIVLFLLLCGIYPLGMIRFPGKSSEKRRKAMDRSLRKIHKSLGIWIIAVALLHGIVEIKAGNLEGMASGKAAFLFLILLLVSYGCKRILREKWLFVHRILAVLAVITVIIHVGGTL